MARYLLESSPVDGYLLEDASGVLLKETFDVDMAVAGSSTASAVSGAIVSSDLAASGTGAGNPLAVAVWNVVFDAGGAAVSAIVGAAVTVGTWVSAGVATVLGEGEAGGGAPGGGGGGRWKHMARRRR